MTFFHDDVVVRTWFVIARVSGTYLFLVFAHSEGGFLVPSFVI